MIKIKNYDKEKQSLSFVSDMSLGLANAIRRSVLEIPILAIDEVEIFKNDSALYDEIIAHRSGLVPIKNGKNKELKLKLKQKGPKTVYSSDFEPCETDYKIPLVILDEGQELELVADAKLGKGIEHIKYSPGLIYYKHYLEDEELLDYITIDEEGKIIYNEDELKELNIGEDILKKIKQLKECKELNFKIEGWRQIEVSEIFPRAIDALDENLKEVDKALK